MMEAPDINFYEHGYCDRLTDTVATCTSKSKNSLSRKRLVGCRIGGAKSKESRHSRYVKVRFGRILQLTVLNLQMKKPICKCRTVIVVGSYQTSL